MTIDLNLLMALDGADCLYAKYGRPPHLVLAEAKEAFGEIAGFFDKHLGK